MCPHVGQHAASSRSLINTRRKTSPWLIKCLSLSVVTNTILVPLVRLMRLFGCSAGNICHEDECAQTWGLWVFSYQSDVRWGRSPDSLSGGEEVTRWGVQEEELLEKRIASCNTKSRECDGVPVDEDVNYQFVSLIENNSKVVWAESQ